MSSVRRLALLVLSASACRFGGPSEDPSAYLTFPSDADDEQAIDGDADASLTEDASIDVGDATPHGDPLSDGPIGDGGDASRDGSTGDGGDGGTCTPPANVSVCDPVTNTGCVLLQCDVDTTMSTATGVCVLASVTPLAESAACTQAMGSTPCQPDLTCFGGSCRRICFCDSDCMGGACCSDNYATTGFKLCDACH
jgi:hypothetical protein